MKLPSQFKSAGNDGGSAAMSLPKGVGPSFLGAALGALNAIPAVVNTGMGLASGIGCPIACARNDRTAIRALGCSC